MADDDVALGDQDEEFAQGFEQLQEDFFAGGIAVGILAVAAPASRMRNIASAPSAPMPVSMPLTAF